MLSAFDPTTESWDFPKIGRFWEAVSIAHSQGRTGRGKTVAIVDGPVDTSVTRIARRLANGRMKMPSPAGEPTGHGTAVSLLVSAVAPDCQLDVYPVFRSDGEPDPFIVTRALAMIDQSSADVVNLSLGIPRDYLAAYMSFLGKHPQWRKAEAARGGGIPVDDDCWLCVDANAVATSRPVVAAAGNSLEILLCPARSEQIQSCGFAIESRDVPGEMGTEVAELTTPSTNTAAQTFALRQVRGALGTSFAAPLLAGFVALGTDLNEFRQFTKAAALAEIPRALHDAIERLLFANTDDETRSLAASSTLSSYFGPKGDWRVAAVEPEVVHEIIALYEHAVDGLPHTQDSDHLTPCAECSLFSEPIYANYGLFLAKYAADLETAQTTLDQLTEFAPWSPHGHANLGALRYMMARNSSGLSPTELIGRLDEAIATYETAVQLRPRNGNYSLKLAEMEEYRASVVRGL